MTKRRSKTASAQQDVGSEWLPRLDRISVAVDAWRERTKNPVAPEPGSSLAADEIDGLSVESPIWYSMCISAEHLEFALNAMRATSTMYPTAYLTVTRTAFIAAVNAVWVLAPNRQLRRERALRLRADDLRAQIAGLRSMKVPEGKPEQARVGVLEQLLERHTSLQAVGTKLGVSESVAGMKFNQTAAIDWVAEHMHGVEDDLLVGATQAVWRSGSAAAHAQYHFGIMRMDRNEVIDEDAASHVVRLRGDLDSDVGPAVAAAAMTLSEAFRLYDLRRVRHIRP
jgi:hypothetical protein